MKTILGKSGFTQKHRGVYQEDDSCPERGKTTALRHVSEPQITPTEVLWGKLGKTFLAWRMMTPDKEKRAKAQDDKCTNLTPSWAGPAAQPRAGHCWGATQQRGELPRVYQFWQKIQGTFCRYLCLVLIWGAQLQSYNSWGGSQDGFEEKDFKAGENKWTNKHNQRD